MLMNGPPMSMSADPQQQQHPLPVHVAMTVPPPSLRVPLTIPPPPLHVPPPPLPPAQPQAVIYGDQDEAVKRVWHEVMSRGVFDALRRDCLADVDTRPAYQNLHARVGRFVRVFLGQQKWSPSLNRNQLRERMGRQLLVSPFLDIGVERIVDQVVQRSACSGHTQRVYDLVHEVLFTPPGQPRPPPPPPPSSSSDSMVNHTFLPPPMSFDNSLQTYRHTDSELNGSGTTSPPVRTGLNDTPKNFYNNQPVTDDSDSRTDKQTDSAVNQSAPAMFTQWYQQFQMFDSTSAPAQQKVTEPAAQKHPAAHEESADEDAEVLQEDGEVLETSDVKMCCVADMMDQDNSDVRLDADQRLVLDNNDAVIEDGEIVDSESEEAPDSPNVMWQMSPLSEAGSDRADDLMEQAEELLEQQQRLQQTESVSQHFNEVPGVINRPFVTGDASEQQAENTSHLVKSERIEAKTSPREEDVETSCDIESPRVVDHENSVIPSSEADNIESATTCSGVASESTTVQSFSGAKGDEVVSFEYTACRSKVDSNVVDNFVEDEVSDEAKFTDVVEKSTTTCSLADVEGLPNSSPTDASGSESVRCHKLEQSTSDSDDVKLRSTSSSSSRHSSYSALSQSQSLKTSKASRSKASTSSDSASSKNVSSRSRSSHHKDYRRSHSSSSSSKHKRHRHERGSSTSGRDHSFSNKRSLSSSEVMSSSQILQPKSPNTADMTSLPIGACGDCPTSTIPSDSVTTKKADVTCAGDAALVLSAADSASESDAVSVKCVSPRSGADCASVLQHETPSFDVSHLQSPGDVPRRLASFDERASGAENTLDTIQQTQASGQKRLRSLSPEFVCKKSRRSLSPSSSTSECVKLSEVHCLSADVETICFPSTCNSDANKQTTAVLSTDGGHCDSEQARITGPSDLNVGINACSSTSCGESSSLECGSDILVKDEVDVAANDRNSEQQLRPVRRHHHHCHHRNKSKQNSIDGASNDASSLVRFDYVGEVCAPRPLEEVQQWRYLQMALGNRRILSTLHPSPPAVGAVERPESRVVDRRSESSIKKVSSSNTVQLATEVCSVLSTSSAIAPSSSDQLKNSSTDSQQHTDIQHTSSQSSKKCLPDPQASDQHKLEGCLNKPLISQTSLNNLSVSRPKRRRAPVNYLALISGDQQ